MDPSLLIIIVFILAPLIERLLKAGKGDQQQAPPRQGPRHRQHLPGQEPGTRPDRPRVELPRREQGPAADDAAADMLPDDLWEILTGEKRAPPQQQPTPYEAEAEPEAYEEEIAADEAESLETTSAGEWISVPPEPEPAPPTQPARRPSAWTDYQAERTASAPARRTPIRVEEGYTRPLPAHETPRVVSLEPLEIDDEDRHTEFHRKLEATRRPRRTGTENPWRFTGDEDLRRAIVMAEVLGTPKGLEGM